MSRPPVLAALALFDSTWPADRSASATSATAGPLVPRCGPPAPPSRSTCPRLLPAWASFFEADWARRDRRRAAYGAGTDRRLPGSCRLQPRSPTRTPSPSLLRDHRLRPGPVRAGQPVHRLPAARHRHRADRLWKLLDGMNAAGLAVSLAYGGDSRTSGEGFAIPVVLRDLWRTAKTMEQAEAALAGLLIAMAYNVTMIDAQARCALRTCGPATMPSPPAAGCDESRLGVQLLNVAVMPRTTAASQRVEQAEGPGGRARDPPTILADVAADRTPHVGDYAGGSGPSTPLTTVRRSARRPIRWPDRARPAHLLLTQ